MHTQTNSKTHTTYHKLKQEQTYPNLTHWNLTHWNLDAAEYYFSSHMCLHRLQYGRGKLTATVWERKTNSYSMGEEN
jgi:hypothetical protein